MAKLVVVRLASGCLCVFFAYLFTDSIISCEVTKRNAIFLTMCWSLLHIPNMCLPLGVRPDEVPSPSPTSSAFPTVIEEIVDDPPVSGENGCSTTDSGVFGDIDGEAEVVSFYYAVELAEGTSESEFTSLMLPDLELAMNDAVLPALFADCAAASTGLRRVLAQGKVSGVSTRPFDSIETDVACTGLNCHGLLGTMTIFISTEERRSLQDESHATIVRKVLQDSMNAGAFDDVAESIVSVTWVDDGLGETPVEKPPPSTDDDGETSTDRSSDNNKIMPWSVAAGAVALIALVALAARRRKRNNNNDDQSQSYIEGNSTINSAI